jgi:23S rRNA A1618 N6-methylase RlmF
VVHLITQLSVAYFSIVLCEKVFFNHNDETKRSFRTRLSEHDRDVGHKKDINIARHFNGQSHDWSKCRFDIIEHLTGDPDTRSTLRLKRETYWIATLRSLAPNGLNVMIGRQFSS